MEEYITCRRNSIKDCFEFKTSKTANTLCPFNGMEDRRTPLIMHIHCIATYPAHPQLLTWLSKDSALC